MALDDLELSLMAFPQRWGGGAIAVNLLILPVGDPTAPLGGGPVFAGTTVHLLANVIAGLEDLPTSTTAPALSEPVVAQPPPVAPALFAALAQQFTAKGIPITSAKLTKKQVTHARIKKSLPDSYTNAFPFEVPRSPDVEVGSGYCCALRAQAPGLNEEQTGPDDSIAWGQILSFVLRQPVLAQALGLIYQFSIPVPAATLAAGGFVYFALDTTIAGNPWVSDSESNSDTVKSYAARLPALGATSRPLFAATLIPIVATPGSNLTAAQLEAAEYDDGFAQVVHSNQPTTIDAATLEADRIPPGTDAGIQVGWDDEQVTIWLNNQLDLLRVRVDLSPAADTPEAPLGVIGYRVDVRLQGATGWSSLCVVNGTLPFSQTAPGPPASTSITGDEFWLAPAPVRPSEGTPGGPPDNSTNVQDAWLPLYFGLWTGSSLVLPDPTVTYLAAAAAASPTGSPPVPPTTPPNPRPDLTGVPVLRYGNDYEFRVRFVDLTGGGPLAADQPLHPGPAPTALARFRRYVPPKALVVDSSQEWGGYPAVPPPTGEIDSLTVRRPRIGYPEAVFAGVDPSTYSPANIAALVATAHANRDALDVPDPDVDSFDVIVEARVPAHDSGDPGTDPGDLDGNFRAIYTVNVPFSGDPSADSAVTLTLDYTDGIDDISTVEAPATGTTTIPIPTARNVRVRLQPVLAARTNYYGPDSPPAGPYSDYIVRKAATVEDPLFPSTPATELSACFFQPGSNIAQLLAQQGGLVQNGLTLSGAAGRRTVFGASGALRHSISGDASSITFSNQTELLGHWIVVCSMELERDWTWDGFVQPSAASAGAPLQSGQPSLSLSVDSLPAPIASIAVPRVVSPATVSDPSTPPDRSGSRIVFFDAIDPNPAPGKFPAVLTPTYTVTATLESGATQSYTLPITLPITTPPAQTPKIVATGLAESAYAASSDYSETSPRDRFLWIEFDRPIADTGDDGYFGRVLAYGPDPILAGELQPTPEPDEMLPETAEPALPIDPEAIRVVFSGQSADESGLDAMTALVPATGGGPGAPATFFMLPLPPGVSAEDLQLFGFWTYEFRVGHHKKWSTAQGRFGRPLRVTGIQHPPPHLTCSVARDEALIAVTAPYATTVLNGRRVFSAAASDPRTEIWFMLYAQVLQADGASYRNILIENALGKTTPAGDPAGPAAPLASAPKATGVFPEKLILTRLELLGLARTSPLSVLAVELLPFGQRVPVHKSVFGEAGGAGEDATGEVGAGEGAVNEPDPLGADLGTRRILRTSPLTALPTIC